MILSLLNKFDSGFEIISRISDLYALLGIAIPICIVIFLIITDKRKVIEQIAESVAEVPNHYYKKFRSYTMQYVDDLTNMKKGISSKQLKKQIRNNDVLDRVWFVIGEAGFGKTFLIEYLMYGYCLRKKMRSVILEDRGVIYIRMSSVLSIDDLYTRVNKSTNKKSILFLDAFDEFRELRYNDAIKVLDEIIGVVEQNFAICKKIVISSRLEPINGGTKTLRDYKLNSYSKVRNSGKLRILQINAFNNKQIYSLYKKIGGSGDDIEKQKRGQNKARMKEHLKNQKTSIFQMPFLICYADVLFKLVSNDKLSSLSCGEIYSNLVNYWIEREFAIYRNNFDKDSKGLQYDSYKENAYKTIFMIIDNMIERKCNNISYEDIRKLSIWEGYLDFNNILTRHLMHQFVDGFYEFAHLSLFEFFLAKKLTQESFEIRKRFLNDRLYVGLRRYYIDELISEKKKTVIDIIASIDSITIDNKVIKAFSISIESLFLLFNAEEVRCNQDMHVFVDDILIFFPLIKSIVYQEMAIQEGDIDAYMTKGILNLSNQGISKLNGIIRFINIRSLNISYNNIIDMRILSKIKDIEELYFYGYTYEIYNSLLNTALKKIGYTVTSLSDLDNFNNYAKTLIRIIDVKGEPEIYGVLYNLSSRGWNIEISSAIDSSILNNYIYNEKDSDNKIMVLIGIYHFHYKHFPYHINTLKTGQALGFNLIEQRKDEEGEKLLRDVYDKQKDVLGENERDTLITGMLIGRNLDYQKKYDESEKLLRDVYEKEKKVLGEKDVDTLIAGRQLGHNLTCQKKYEEGEKLLRDVYEKEIEVLGEKAEGTLLTSGILGLNLTKQKKYEEGEKLLRDVYEKGKEVLGENAEIILVACQVLGSNLTYQKKYEEGEKLLRDVYEKGKEVLGENTEITLVACQLLGLNLTQQKKYEEGEKLLRDVYEKGKEVLGENAEIILVACQVLGSNLTYQKKYEEGEKLLRDVYEKGKDVLGENAEVTLAAWQVLESNLTEQKNCEKGEKLLRDVAVVKDISKSCN